MPGSVSVLQQNPGPEWLTPDRERAGSSLKGHIPNLSVSIAHIKILTTGRPTTSKPARSVNPGVGQEIQIFYPMLSALILGALVKLNLAIEKPLVPAILFAVIAVPREGLAESGKAGWC
jgi:hypothetical protein